MSWITVIWSTALGMCLMMMVVHLLVWGRDRRSWANLLFALAVLSVIGLVAIEMVSMYTESPQVFGACFRWAHFFYGVGVFASLGLVHFYFGTGRLWLLLLALGLRFCAVVANFTTGANLHVLAVHSLQKMYFLGAKVSIIGEWTPNPWVRLGQLAAVVQIAYVIDASLRLWRKGSPDARRRALTIGVSLSFFMIFAAAQAALVTTGTLRMPFLVSLPFLGMVSAMGYELSRDVLRAAQLVRELSEEERRLDLAARAGGLGMWHWDVATDHVWMNEKGRLLFGFPAEARINAEQFRSRIHPDDREAARAVAAKALPIGADYESEYRAILPDGTTRWLYSRGRVDLDANGKPNRVHGVTLDITERTLSEKALRESEARFRTVADVAPVMIWMSATDKLCNFFNKGWLEFTGRTLQQELGNGWVKGVHTDDLTHCLSVYETAFDKREPFTMEYRLRRHDGEHRWVVDTGTPRFDPDGTFLGYIGSCIDIGDRKQAELEHQAQSMELARVGRVALLGELAASLAHEINNPVGAMVTNANAGQRLIANGQSDPAVLQELLADIAADGHRAREVIRGIRNMVRRTEPSHSLVQISDIIHDLLRVTRADALARKIMVATEIDPACGQVRADRVQLLQVLLNLTINAFDALSIIRSDLRRVLIEAKCHPGEVLITVQDSGPGFPPGIVEQLFEPFYTTKSEGTGMGLAIARTIVEAHGGTLSANNSSTGGACFTLRLPEAKEDKKGNRGETDERDTSRSTPANSEGGKRYRLG